MLLSDNSIIFLLAFLLLSGVVLPEEGTMRKKEGAAFPLREYGP
jgi:hypothetical protein